MGDEMIAVPVGKKAGSIHGVVKLNAEGKEIFELLETETTEERIVETLRTKYDNDSASLERFVRTVVNSLRKANLLEQDT